MKKIDTLHDGAYFGDAAFNSKAGERPFRTVTATDCHFACMSKTEYMDGLAKCMEKVKLEEIRKSQP